MYFIETSQIGTVIFMLKAFLMVEKMIAAFYYLKNQCSELSNKKFHLNFKFNTAIVSNFRINNIFVDINCSIKFSRQTAH